VGGAWKLGQLDASHEVTLFERNAHLGGNSGSFQHEGHWLDFGSHRLHPACDEGILGDIQRLLGEDLLDRPRHGRIRLMGRWVHFPLAPLDLLLHCDRSFALGSLSDALLKPFRGGTTEPETFESVLRANLGPTICDHFYFPYARKLWGLEPAQLSAIQAHKRVSAGTFVKLLKKLLPASSRPGTSGSRRFYYPREGFGQITRAYADAARAQGADLRLGWTALSAERTAAGGWRVRAGRGDEIYELTCDQLWSTIPVTLLAGLLRPEPPAEILEHARSIDYRAMILVYLELATDQFTEFDAHYFPGQDVTLTRLSEPKNYAARSEPEGRTMLCAEIPCQFEDETWSASDEELGTKIVADLERSGLSIGSTPKHVFTRRLPQAYPIYQNGYEQALEPLDRWVAAQEGLLSYGRQGLFAHDNTHHALSMAYAAAECVRGTDFDRERWNSHREAFSRHVVED
jgi:protoporphyrinogen oxidase